MMTSKLCLNVNSKRVSYGSIGLVSGMIVLD